MGFIVSFALRIWIVKRITWSGRKGTLPISVCGDGSTAGIYNFIYSACRPAMSLCRTVNQVGRSSSVLYLFVCLFFFVAPITYKMDNGTSQPLDYTVFIYHWCICAIFVWNKSNSKQREERKKEWLWVNAVPGNKQNLRRWNYRTIYTARFEWCMYVLGAILLLSQTALCIIYIYIQRHRLTFASWWSKIYARISMTAVGRKGYDSSGSKLNTRRVYTTAFAYGLCFSICFFFYVVKWFVIVH